MRQTNDVNDNQLKSFLPIQPNASEIHLLAYKCIADKVDCVVHSDKGKHHDILELLPAKLTNVTEASVYIHNLSEEKYFELGL